MLIKEVPFQFISKMGKVETICIIDDDKIFTFATKRLLSINDCCDRIIEFKNGKEALKGLKSILSSETDVPDIIFLDLNMPIMDGWEFLDEFKTLKKLDNTKIYILTSSIDPADIEKSKTYTLISDFITKPINKDKLEKIINLGA